MARGFFRNCTKLTMLAFLLTVTSILIQGTLEQLYICT